MNGAFLREYWIRNQCALLMACRAGNTKCHKHTQKKLALFMKEPIQESLTNVYTKTLPFPNQMGVYGGSVLFDSFNKVDVDRNGTLDFSE